MPTSAFIFHWLFCGEAKMCSDRKRYIKSDGLSTKYFCGCFVYSIRCYCRSYIVALGVGEVVLWGTSMSWSAELFCLFIFLQRSLWNGAELAKIKIICLSSCSQSMRIKAFLYPIRGSLWYFRHLEVAVIRSVPAKELCSPVKSSPLRLSLLPC